MHDARLWTLYQIALRMQPLTDKEGEPFDDEEIAKWALSDAKKFLEIWDDFLESQAE